MHSRPGRRLSSMAYLIKSTSGPRERLIRDNARRRPGLCCRNFDVTIPYVSTDLQHSWQPFCIPRLAIQIVTTTGCAWSTGRAGLRVQVFRQASTPHTHPALTDNYRLRRSAPPIAGLSGAVCAGSNPAGGHCWGRPLSTGNPSPDLALQRISWFLSYAATRHQMRFAITVPGTYAERLRPHQARSALP
jgi:hypothetical protein